MLDPPPLAGTHRAAKVGQNQESENASSSSSKTRTGATEKAKSVIPSEGAGSSDVRKPKKRDARPYAEAQQANAARRERDEWERTRGAGSKVLLWFENLRLNDPSKLKQFHWNAVDVVPTVDDLLARHSEPVEVVGMDRLLEWGLCDYTILPKTLGRGRFSTVYLAVKNGQRYAIKHTPLFPHHELVATRLLREPTLLAELPPHPNLVQVVETIRTPGHFYLVEEFLDGYVTLEALVTKLSTSKAPNPPVLPQDVAETVFDQLVLALHAIHTPLRVCHRDVKPENILVHPVTLQLKLLDFGLATHFSRSRAKLTTCCGSPAFHCPEIVVALSQPPGTAAYWGPEVDAWTCGLVLLRCLSGVRYPLGISHTSPAAMEHRAQKAIAALPPSPLRDDIEALLTIDGEKRMENFDKIAERTKLKWGGNGPPVRRELKCTSFIPAPPQHAMVLPLVLTKQSMVGPLPDFLMSAQQEYSRITLLNTSRQPSPRVLSFIKYCFRCAGILYHTIPLEDKPRSGSRPASPSGHRVEPSSSGPYVFQCVVELSQDEDPNPIQFLVDSFWSLFGKKPKAEELVKLPKLAQQQHGHGDAVRPSSGPSGYQGPLKMLVFYMVVTFSKGNETPLLQDMETPSPEMITKALQHRLAPAKLQSNPTSQRTSLDEPELHMESRSDSLPPVQVVPRPRMNRSRSSRGNLARAVRPAPRPTAVNVFVSDPRVLPYVRGALSNGGLLKGESLVPTSSRESPPPSAGDKAERRSGSATPEPRRDFIGPHELATSLDAIESTCRSLLLRRTLPEREDTNDTYAHQLYTLVHRLYRGLEAALASEQAEALRREMAEQNFRALSVLGPALALVSEHDVGRSNGAPLPPEQMHPSSTTGSLALCVLELFCGCCSAKEMCLGFQEQIERLSLAWHSRDEELSTEDLDAATMLARNGADLVQATLGQLQRLSNVVPAIQTRRPKPLLESVLGLLYPGVYQDVIVDALGTVDDANVREDLATQAAVVLCELTLGLSSLSRSLPEEKRPDLGRVLVDGLVDLIPFLPSPRATVDGRHLWVCEMDPQTTTVSPRITVWNIVRKTFDELDIDLGLRCLGPSDLAHVPRAPPSESATHHDFVLLVQQLAYESLAAQVKRRTRFRLLLATQRQKKLPEPARWSPEVARELLSRLASVLPGTLLPGLGPMDVAHSAATITYTHDQVFCDALVAFVRWCVTALDGEQRSRPPLDDDCATYVVRALALVATSCTDAHLRQASFSMVTRLIRDHSSDEVAVPLIREMMSPEAPAPLRGATVHLVRDLCAARMDRLDAGQVYSDALLADGRLWRVWNDELFVVPAPLPSPPSPGSAKDEALAKLSSCMAQHQTYLQECCSLLYYVTVRDAQHNYTGMADESEATRLRERFVVPLERWVAAWQTALAPADAEDAAVRGLELLAVALTPLQRTAP